MCNECITTDAEYADIGPEISRTNNAQSEVFDVVATAALINPDNLTPSLSLPCNEVMIYLKGRIY